MELNVFVHLYKTYRLDSDCILTGLIMNWRLKIIELCFFEAELPTRKNTHPAFRSNAIAMLQNLRCR